MKLSNNRNGRDSFIVHQIQSNLTVLSLRNLWRSEDASSLVTNLKRKQSIHAMHIRIPNRLCTIFIFIQSTRSFLFVQFRLSHSLIGNYFNFWCLRDTMWAIVCVCVNNRSMIAYQFDFEKFSFCCSPFFFCCWCDFSEFIFFHAF